MEDTAEIGDSAGTELDLTKEDGTGRDGGSGSSVSRAVEGELRVEEQVCSITKSQGRESKVEVTGSV